METMMDLKKGLYFKNDLELERALMILMENGFELNESMETVYDVEVALAVENKRLATRFQKKSAFLF